MNHAANWNASYYGGGGGSVALSSSTAPCHYSGGDGNTPHPRPPATARGIPSFAAPLYAAGPGSQSAAAAAAAAAAKGVRPVMVTVNIEPALPGGAPSPPCPQSLPPPQVEVYAPSPSPRSARGPPTPSSAPAGGDASHAPSAGARLFYNDPYRLRA
ncbi:hypothetical protein STCU_11209 [Strigomonas culicis]|uniref:Uncharacterized protein n=1 Tax=Strigomonas culicis TaxID=28005 RepID=S9TEL9_9TRYP|nr:hypothetical protein STCU_11209 [Strigomonas culicis]|eukprot:EPY16492.1 hypothetical protein STCU_11209 [Strigomonas culicis]